MTDDARELVWIGEHAPTAAALATVVDQVMGLHTTWDLLPHFMFLVRLDDGALAPTTVHAFDPGMSPSLIPALMCGFTAKHLRECAALDERPVVGVLFEYEGHVIEGGAMTAAEEQAMRARKLYTLPRARESAFAAAVDVGGRLMWSSKYRGVDGAPDEVEPAGPSPNRSGRTYTGPYVNGLRNAARLLAPGYVAATQGRDSRV